VRSTSNGAALGTGVAFVVDNSAKKHEFYLSFFAIKKLFLVFQFLEQ